MAMPISMELVPTEYQYGNYLYSSIISSPSVPEEKITALQNIENEYDVWPAGIFLYIKIYLIQKG